MLKVLSNPHRLLILCLLVEGEKAVGELAEHIGMRDSSVSQQLAILRAEGIVSARREAQTVWYELASPEAKKILETLYKLYCTPEPLCGRVPKPKKRKRK